MPSVDPSFLEALRLYSLALAAQGDPSALSIDWEEKLRNAEEAHRTHPLVMTGRVFNRAVTAASRSDRQGLDPELQNVTIGLLALHEGELPLARAALTAALRSIDETDSPHTLLVALVFHALAMAALQAGDFEDANEHQLKALDIWNRALDSNETLNAYGELGLARINDAAGDSTGADMMRSMANRRLNRQDSEEPG
jgi:tetratricopeptide (TPR) repeat protein